MTSGIELHSGSGEADLSGDQVLPKCAALVNACGKTEKPLPSPWEHLKQNRTWHFSCVSVFTLDSEEGRPQNTKWGLETQQWGHCNPSQTKKPRWWEAHSSGNHLPACLRDPWQDTWALPFGSCLSLFPWPNTLRIKKRFSCPCGRPWLMYWVSTNDKCQLNARHRAEVLTHERCTVHVWCWWDAWSLIMFSGTTRRLVPCIKSANSHALRDEWYYFLNNKKTGAPRSYET